MSASSLKWRWIVIALMLLWAAYEVLPNFAGGDKKPAWMGSDRLKYGLDIQGGLYLVMGVDTQGVLRQETERAAQAIQKSLATEGTPASKVDVSGDNRMSVAIDLTNPADADKAKAYMDKWYKNLLLAETSGGHLVYTQSDVHVAQTTENAIDQAIETIRNRVDEFGVSEPSITKQGSDRILIQLPLRDTTDVNRAKDLINRTAHLEFNIVSEKMKSEELRALIDKAEKDAGLDLGKMTYLTYVDKLNVALKGKIPEKSIVRFARDERVKDIKEGKIPYLLQTDTNLGGDSLEGAGVTYGQFGEPEVSLNFNADGAKRFEDLTGANTNRQMAILMDEVVYSAPNIKDKISGGHAVITLGRGDRDSQMNEAKTISMALRSGALPARLEQLEERTVGPSLGADAIARGVHATIIGGLLIIIFMVVWYRTMGFIADIALIINILMILAVLTALDATLTLPGIAGLALTMGMAVDANVIINERIKDELKKGASMMNAVRVGYSKAMSAIWDGNLATIGICVVLFHFGTGPVRGFAIMLIIGLCASMFTAIFMTRTIVDHLMGKLGWRYISIGFDKEYKAFQEHRSETVRA